MPQGPEPLLDDAVPSASVVPAGRPLTLPGRGTTYLREAPGPEAAPTVLLLHGWLATGALNWFRCFEPLAQHFNVVAIDHRGHGQGIRSSRRFRLADCAADAAGAIESLGAGPVIAVGYSMGGPIAQLLWRDHRHLVDGLVLVATGAEFVPGNRHRYAASALLVAAAGTGAGISAARVPRRAARRLLPKRTREHPPAVRPDEEAVELREWGRLEMGRHSARVMLEAAHAVAQYSSRSWIDEIDVPTTVIVTEADSAVSPEAQLRMAMSIPGAHISRIPGGHVSCMDLDFGRKVTDACLDVRRRVELGYRPLPPPDVRGASQADR